MRLPSPLSAAARLLGRERAAVRGRVLDALSGSREGPTETTVTAGAVELSLCLPAGNGPHPAVMVISADGQAFARALATDGVAAVPVPTSCPPAALHGLAASLAGRGDINPHEIGLVLPLADPSPDDLPVSPVFAFVERGPEAGLRRAILARVTLAEPRIRS